MLSSALACATLVLLSPLVVAQREEARLVHGKSECVIEYGAPPWSKHGLDELPVGGSWRLGFNEATEWRTQAPIVQGDLIVAPGSYRIALQRTAEREFAIEFSGAALALPGQGEARLTCTLADDKLAKKLAIGLSKGAPQKAPGDPKQTAAADPGLATRVNVHFGPHRLDGDFTLAAGRDVATSPKYRLVGWSLPSKLVTERLARGEGVPIATFMPTQKPRRSDPAAFNVVLTKDGVELVPGMLMPTDSFGFGKVAPPLPEWRQAGSVVWSDLPQDTPRLELRRSLSAAAEAAARNLKSPRQWILSRALSGKLDRKAKQYVLDLRCGQRGAVVQVPEPRAKD